MIAYMLSYISNANIMSLLEVQFAGYCDYTVILTLPPTRSWLEARREVVWEGLREGRGEEFPHG